MKHFEIGIQACNHLFTYECTSAAEAYDAIMDASIAFGFEVDMDEVMGVLVDMKRGDALSHQKHHFQIAYRDGEV